MKKILFFILIMMIPFVVSAKKYEIEFFNTIGGNGYDFPNNILYLPDQKEFAIFSTTTSNEILDMKTNVENPYAVNYEDVLFVKYDLDGNITNKAVLGGSKGEYLAASNINKSGEILLYGNSSSVDFDDFDNRGLIDGIFYKYDKDGNLLLKKSWGGNKEDRFSNAILLDDGSFIVVGSTSSTDINSLTNKGGTDALFVKFDKNGNVVWEKSFGGNSSDSFSDIILSNDGNFIITGTTSSTNIENIQSYGKSDIVIIKIDTDGNLLFEKIVGGSGNDNISYLLNYDNSFLLVFNYSSDDIINFENKGSNDIGFIKYDYDGNQIFNKSWGTNGGDVLRGVKKNENGDIYLIGQINSNDNENLIVVGSSDGYIIKFDKELNVIFETTWGTSDFDTFFDIQVFENDSFIVCGSSMSKDINGFENKGAYDIVLLKYSYKYDLNISDTVNGFATVIQDGDMGIITPSPNHGYEVDEIIVKDTAGNDIETVKQEDGVYSFELNDDVTVEVLFKQIIENPKTGIRNITGILFTICLCFISVFLVLKNYNKSYEL